MVWLEGTEKRKKEEESAPGEWPIAFHGTSYENAVKIVVDGFDTTKCTNNNYDTGVYSTPSFDAAISYANLNPYRDKKDGLLYVVILQCRVNPETVKVIPENETNHKGAEYWLTQNADDIRPYKFIYKPYVEPKCK